LEEPTNVIVRALHVGKAETHTYQGKPVETGFFKDPVEGARFLSKLGFEGDTQVDQVHHGGPDKAALLYALEHYTYWRHELGKNPGPAALGENLTVDGFTETTVCIGDVYRIGGAVVQVCQPRVPCFKTAIRHGVPDMVERITACGYTGIYGRVLTEGPVAAGDEVTLLERRAGAPTVAHLNDLLYRDTKNTAAMQAAIAVEQLADVWKQMLRRRLG
jgi:MOSC domain-containing protein YiiM